jgi:lipopolysaccharide/colanic/teichoic acid biosynthesis glycosyltransferase
MTEVLPPEVAAPRHRGRLRSFPRGREAAVRGLDLVLGATALLLTAPVFLVVYLAVRLTSPGPGFFRQPRVGAGRREFVMYKFRTMRRDADPSVHEAYVRDLLRGEVEPEDGLYKLADDPRITKVGALLRRTSLDELPQLFNVLKGEMSLVGPRPCLPSELAEFPDWADRRFDVRPGLTGLWQVSGRNRLTMTEGLRLDVQYVARRTLLLYLVILLRTVPAVLGHGAR